MEEIKEYNKRDGRRIKAICDKFCFLWMQSPQQTFTQKAIELGLVNELGGNWDTPDDTILFKLGIKNIREFPFRTWKEYTDRFINK